MRSFQSFYLDVLHTLPVLAHERTHVAAASEETPAAFIHAWARRALLARLKQRPLVERIAIIALWPAAAFITTVYMEATRGGAVRRSAGPGLVRQAVDQFRLALNPGIPAIWYYVLGLYRSDLREQAGAYVLRHEMKRRAVYADLRRYSGGEDDPDFGDKLAFYRFCPANDLATVRVHCLIARDGAQWIAADHRLPERDVFVKPRKSRGGRGAERWHWRGDGFTDDRGRTRTHDELLDDLARRSGPTGFLVQDRLRNHDAITALNVDALSTVRILVIRDEHWRAEVVHAYLRMAREPGVVVDNVHAGGFAAPVAIATGRLGAATDLSGRASAAPLTHHPHSGAVIERVVLPYWSAACELALRAHETKTACCVAGWDIAILEDGPVLIEANAAPCVDSTQRMLQRPIGNARFGHLIAFHLKRLQQGLGPPDTPSGAS